MKTPLYALRAQSPLTQTDIATLLGRGNGGVSQMELGKVSPTLPLLLIYHLLFSTPIETLVQGYREHMRLHLIENLPKCIQALKDRSQTPMLEHRIKHLEDTLIRLTAQA